MPTAHFPTPMSKMPDNWAYTSISTALKYASGLPTSAKRRPMPYFVPADTKDE